MTAINQQRHTRSFARLAMFAAALLLPQWASAESPATAVDLERVALQIEAGEFGPAAEAIAQLHDVLVRDQYFTRLALAQSAAGAQRAALATTSEIESDRLYSETLRTLSQQPIGAAGGGPQADFDSLINLIHSTVAPDTWDEVGGPGAVDGFEGGVFVDAAGVMRRTPQRASAQLARLREVAARQGANHQWRVPSEFRKVSLPRLERDVMREYAAGRDPTETMQYLAGLNRVTHVLLYPETGDVVLAGPAGDYTLDSEGRAVSVDSGRPLVRLDDLVVVLRNAMTENSRFGCSITPRKEGLAATKAFLQQSSGQPLKPAARDRWLADLRDTLGAQDITVYGIDQRTRAGLVLVEADYRMKLVGMGLEEGTLGVESYLSAIPQPAAGEGPPPMDVLRWWFTLNYSALRTTEARNAFELRGQGVQVKSENELISDQGERIHTGEADELNRRFTHSFTQHFEELAVKYPVYAELRNVFDLAIVSAVIVREDAAGQTDWTPTHFAPEGDYRPALGATPKEVETVINHRVLGGKHIVAGVSGGVRVDIPTWYQERERYELDEYGLVIAAHANSKRPEGLDKQAWWWD